jgi:hypothetical protein
VDRKKFLKRLNLEDDKFEVPEEKVLQDERGFNPSICLVGRFLTNKPIRTI